MPLTLDHIVVRNEGCISADLSGSAAILQPDTGIYYGVNEVGASVWDFLKTPRKGHDVLVQLLEEYDVQADVCRDDLLALLADL